MNITKYLTRNGKPFAVMLHDHELEYPVFLETLTNNVCLDALIKSGWKLTSLPCGLEKDGMALSDLPTEEYHPTPAQEQDMWDMIGTPLTQEELKARLSTDSAKFLKLPKGNYRINSRAEFLKYLEAIEGNEQTEDFLPLNYFVHPSALFTFEEYMSLENSKYVEIISSRRVMSLPKFRLLVNWALNNGLQKDFKPIDLVAFYFQWGIDGLNVPIISKHRENRYITLGAPLVGPDQHDMVAIKHKEYGYMDRWGDIQLPDAAYKPGVKWIPTQSEKVLSEIQSMLDDNEVTMVECKTNTFEEVEVLETVSATITYNANIVLLGSRRMPTLQARSFDKGSGMIHNRFWNPNMEQELNDDMFLRAIATELIYKLTDHSDVSSYKALLESGCSPMAALIYMASELGLESPDKIQEEQFTPVTDLDIYDYCHDQLSSPEKIEIIDNMVNGLTNIDMTQTGLKADTNADPSRYYLSFYVAYKVLGLSPEEIYRAVQDIKDDDKVLNLHGKGKTLKIDLVKIEGMHNGFKADKTAYRHKQANTAEEIVYVDSVARELGSPEADRHVAMSLYVFRKLGKAKTLLENLVTMYTDRVHDTIPGLQRQKMYLDSAMVWACGAFFDIALKGIYRFPKEMGDEINMATPEMRQAYYKHLEYCVEDTLSYCDTMADPQDNGCDFLRYSVNAIITPERVYPRKGFFIKETAFAAVWPNYANQPAIQQALIQNSLITHNFVCWDTLFAQRQTLVDHEIGTTGMDVYYEKAERERVNFPANKVFVSATHPLQYRYPKFFEDNAEEMETLNPPREGAPMFKIGNTKMLNGEQVDPFAESLTDSAAVAEAPIQRFYGLTAEDFYFTQGRIQYPLGHKKKLITVVDDRHFYTDETGIQEFSVIETLDQSAYPVNLIRGRKYILRDSAGKYWTVSI